ncbi:MAG: GDSL-type esterase/lipase family protein [Candidatus Cloacimonetes bacterium]|nr:GDSL-type esterase/lipase family protein [Candidatus Cloacimonadota bacterium]
MKRRLPYIFLILVLLTPMLIRLSGEETDENIMLLYDEDYPEDLDTLEEFIQSYYLLLDSDNYLKSYKYISHSKNKLHNDQIALSQFYRKLLELRNGRREQVVIYQIGDSHVQSGYFSGTARSTLQKYFGNAGRGLVFPLKAAKTNQPDDYRISVSGAYQKSEKPRSLSGYTLKMGEQNSLEIKTNNFFNIDCRFDEVLVISDGDSQLSRKDNPWSRHYQREIHGDYLVERLRKEDYSNQCNLKLGKGFEKLYGLSLQRSEGGLLYHSMGVNGAGFYTLADESELFDQIRILQPDLIIVSLGTNDAMGTYRADFVRGNLMRFVSKLSEANPESELLFTLPPDSYKGGRPNADLAKLEKEISELSKAKGYAYWQLSEVMGGKGSVSKWRNNGMAAKDLLHYTPKGYMLQGQLFYQALLKGYKDYSEVREIK